MDPDQLIAHLRNAAMAARSGTATDRARAFQVARDALETAQAAAISVIETSAAYELEGSSTLTGWAGLQLRLPTHETKTLLRADHTMTQLPAVAEAAASGTIRVGHVNAFAYGIKHIGVDIMADSMDWLLDLATTVDPVTFHRAVRGLREALYPDSLDEAWARGMDRQDIKVIATPEGWHVTGFLNTTAGAKLKAVLDSISAPRDKDDQRSGAERRVQGIDDLCTRLLESGLPSDKGVMPQLTVLIDADTLEHQLADQSTGTAGLPAELTGYGPIGPAVLGMIACTADLTPILTRNDQVLDVGRSRRLATRKQRQAVLAQQRGICAAPGCTHTHLEIHHTRWWSTGGPTDLDNLIGLCVRCHHLVHRDLLQIITTVGDGTPVFVNADNRQLLDDRRRRIQARRETAALTRAVLTTTQQRRQPDYWLRA